MPVMLAPRRSACESLARSHSARSMIAFSNTASLRSESKNRVSENLQAGNSQDLSDSADMSAKLRLQASKRALVRTTEREIWRWKSEPFNLQLRKFVSV